MKIKATISGRPKHYYSVYQKMIVRGRDLTTSTTSWASASWSNAFATATPSSGPSTPATSPSRALQGLHRDPEVQPVPVPAHHRDRSRGQAGRAADPHARHAPEGRVRGRRALAVQAVGDGPRRRPTATAEMGWLRQIADWQQETADPSDFLDALRGEIGPAEVYVFTPGGKRPRPARGVDARRLRLRRPHRGGAPDDRREGQRAPRPPRLALENGDTVEILTSSDENAAPDATGWSSSRAAGAQQDPAWFTKERREEASSRAATCSPARCASRTCRSAS